MLPQAVLAPFKFIIHSLAALALNQALPCAAILDDDDPQFGVNFSFSVPVAAGRTDFYFSRDNQFLAHDQCRAGCDSGQSVSRSNGSIADFI